MPVSGAGGREEEGGGRGSREKEVEWGKDHNGTSCNSFLYILAFLCSIFGGRRRGATSIKKVNFASL